MPEDALKEPIEVVCKLCQQSFTAHRYLYTHLSDTHFQPEIGKKLGITQKEKNFRITFLFFYRSRLTNSKSMEMSKMPIPWQ